MYVHYMRSQGTENKSQDGGGGMSLSTGMTWAADELVAP